MFCLEFVMKRVFASIILIMLVNLVLTGCGSNSSTSTTTMQSQSGNVFVTGEDAPLPSVVGFDVTINSITLNGQSNSPQVISTPTTVDFARLLGLRSPLSFNSVPADTYSSATFVLVKPVISYVDMTQNPPAFEYHQRYAAPVPLHPDSEFPYSYGCGQQRPGWLENGF
jgi:hypothetical protein